MKLWAKKQALAEYYQKEKLFCQTKSFDKKVNVSYLIHCLPRANYFQQQIPSKVSLNGINAFHVALTTSIRWLFLNSPLQYNNVKWHYLEQMQSFFSIFFGCLLMLLSFSPCTCFWLLTQKLTNIVLVHVKSIRQDK